jgi:signal transduction histidine kinase
MPEPIRTANEGLRSRQWRDGFLSISMAASFCLVHGTPAYADVGTALAAVDILQQLFSGLGQQEVTSLSLLLGLICFSLLAVIALLKSRRTVSQTKTMARGEALMLHAEIDRLKALLLSEPQILVAWGEAEEPDVVGDSSFLSSGDRPERVLAFGTWLKPATAQVLEHAVERLRGEGRGFVMNITSTTGTAIEAEGRAIGGHAILRIRDISGIKRKLVDTLNQYDQLKTTVETLRALLDSLPTPVWARDTDARLAFVNSAYARAVDAKDPNDAVERDLELIERSSRADLAQARAASKSYVGRLPAIVNGQRRIFEVVDTPVGRGSAGMAIDRTDTENMRSELAHMIDAHRRVLDQLATGVTIFSVDRKLIFYNTAFRSLFDLNAGFLDQMPTDSALLDAMRADRKLPEQQDFRQWKQQLYEAYRATEPQEHMWHLPDGRTLRVVTTPNPEGGVTYLYEDVTERLDMHRRYDALIKVQSETLDHLAEAVAVFGSDGRAWLHNPAFQRMWKVSAGALDQHPHAETVTSWCQSLHDDGSLWRNMRAAITAIDGRDPITARIERRDGVVIDLATTPLPDGATLVTCQDVTDSVNVERALRERNEALLAADSIKIEFVHHVSYELRSPLTNIIGFANLLNDPVFGPLTVKQREYLGYITTSTNSLLAIINNILDLATIDSGTMTLNLSKVDIHAGMEAAAEGLRDRLVKNDITLDIRTSPAIGSFTADEQRLRQVLFNLLSNAVGFSPAGETVTLSAERRSDVVVFKVTDRGPGIPANARDKVFDWFETDPKGSEHRGTGLGLSLVRSFVELHGGKVSIESDAGNGTTITCSFPAEEPIKAQTAA